MTNYNYNNGQGEDDGSLAFLNLPTPAGQKKSFHCEKTTQQKLINKTFWIIDYEKDVKTKFSDDKYIVFIKMDLNDPDDKAKLHRLVRLIGKDIAALGQSIKGNWQIYPVDSRGIDYIGYRFFHGYTLLRKSIKQDIFRLIAEYGRGQVSEETFRMSMPSRIGWLDWCDSYRLKEKIKQEIIKAENKRKDLLHESTIR